MAILDANGRPMVSPRRLSREIASPSIDGLRDPFITSVATGLTPAKLARILSRSNERDNRDFLTLAEEMEERDPHYFSVLQTRKLAVGGTDISVEAGTDDAQSVLMQDEITALTKTPQFRVLLFNALDAIAKGYSVNEIIWDLKGTNKDGQPRFIPKVYKYRDPKFFLFDEKTAEELRLRDTADPAFGIALEPMKFIEHRHISKSGLTLRGGIARQCAAFYLAKSFTLRSWMVYSEVFGIPLRIGKYEPEANREEKAKLLRAVTMLGTDAAAVMPSSMTIEFQPVPAGAGGAELFRGFGDFLNAEMSKAVLGQTMTTEDGSSMAQAKVHNEVRLDIAQADAAQLEGVLNEQLVDVYIALNFGDVPEELRPRIRIPIDEPEDVKELFEAMAIGVDRGLKIEQSFARDKLGAPEPEDDADVLEARGGSSTPPDDGTEPVPPTEPPTEPPETPPTDLQRFLQAQDAFDRMSLAEAEEWRPVLDPILRSVFDLARESGSEKEFRDSLEKTLLNQADVGPFVDRLALLMFQARGIGDATDNVEGL